MNQTPFEAIFVYSLEIRAYDRETEKTQKEKSLSGHTDFMVTNLLIAINNEFVMVQKDYDQKQGTLREGLFLSCWRFLYLLNQLSQYFVIQWFIPKTTNFRDALGSILIVWIKRIGEHDDHNRAFLIFR